MNHEISQSWIEKTSTEVLKNSGFGKMPQHFMSWPVRYLPTFHSNSRKSLQTASMPHTAFHYSRIPLFHVGGIKAASLKAIRFQYAIEF
jgi:hypothetical protein